MITEEEEQEEEQDLRRQKLFQRKKWISLKKRHQMKTESEKSDSEVITPEKLAKREPDLKTISYVETLTIKELRNLYS